VKKLNEHKEYQEASAILAKLGARKAALEAEETAITQARYLEKEPVNANAVERALKLLDGQEGAKVRTDEQRLSEIGAELDVLGKGYRQQKEKVDAITDLLTADANRSVQPAYKAAMGVLLVAYQNVAAATQAFDKVVKDLHEAGYEILGHILPAPHVDLRQFQESVPESGINHLARQIKGLAK
jgi:hypothetical protein